MSKERTTTVYMAIGDGQGTTFGAGGLEKEAHLKKKVWDNEKLENRDSIIFLLLLDTTKSCTGFSELQVFEYLSSSSFFILFYIVP